MEKELFLWILIGFFVSLIGSKKEKYPNISDVFSMLLKVWLSPLWFIIFPIEMFLQRKKSKWLKKNWLLLGFKNALLFTFNEL